MHWVRGRAAAARVAQGSLEGAGLLLGASVRAEFAREWRGEAFKRACGFGHDGARQIDVGVGVDAMAAAVL